MLKVISLLTLLPFIHFSKCSESTNTHFDFPVPSLEQHVFRGIGLSLNEPNVIGCTSGCENGGVCDENICNCTGTGHEGEFCQIGMCL